MAIDLADQPDPSTPNPAIEAPVPMIAGVPIVSNWKTVLWRSMSMWGGYLGLALPELIDLLLKAIEPGGVLANGLSPEMKNYIRAGALVFIIVTRPILQKSLHVAPKE